MFLIWPRSIPNRFNNNDLANKNKIRGYRNVDVTLLSCTWYFFFHIFFKDPQVSFAFFFLPSWSYCASLPQEQSNSTDISVINRAFFHSYDEIVCFLTAITTGRKKVRDIFFIAFSLVIVERGHICHPSSFIRRISTYSFFFFIIDNFQGLHVNHYLLHYIFDI